MPDPLVVRSRRRQPIRAIAAMVLGSLLVAACGNPPSPSPSGTPGFTPASSPTPSASGSAEPVACTTADLAATGGPWGGAAGSRGSDIVVENHGAAACLLPAAPTTALVDQAGTVVLANTPSAAGTGPALEPGRTAAFSLVLGNWCDEQVGLPLHVSLALASGSIDVANLAITTLDDLPPCNGPGQPASISATDWQA